MKTDNFYDLTKQLNDLLTTQKITFDRVYDTLCQYNQQDYVNMLNQLLEEVIHNQKLPKVAEQHMYLIRQEHISLVLRLLGQTDSFDRLSASDYDAYLINLGQQAIKIPRLKCHIDTNDLAIRPPQLTHMPPVTLAPNTPFYQPAFDSLLLLHQCETQIPILIFKSKSYAATTWEFDLTSKAPSKRIATDLQTSRIQVALKVMEAMNMDNDAVASVLEQLCLTSKADFLRWDAVKLLYKTNKQKGFEIVDKLSRDASSQSIQQAAIATKKRLLEGRND